MSRTISTVIASLALFIAPPVISASIFAPDGLTEGDMYHLAFVTQGERDATSTDIADYNTFVQDQAALNPSLTGTEMGVMYNAIASTSLIDAKDNALVEAPVYLFNGTKIADDYADIWDGNIHDFLNVNQFGVTVSPQSVWTGSYWYGARATPNQLGSYLGIQGYTDQVNGMWAGWDSKNTTNTQALYGLSEKHTYVVPEPSSALVSLLLGLIGVLMCRLA